jgi:hypothetical protein
MRTAAALLASLLLVLAACDLEPAEPADGDVVPPITRDQVDALLRSHPELRARLKEWGRDHPEDAARARKWYEGLSKSDEVESPDVAPADTPFLGDDLGEWIVLGAGTVLGLLLALWLVIGIVQAVAGDTGGLGSREREIRRRYLAECERRRQREERDRPRE